MPRYPEASAQKIRSPISASVGPGKCTEARQYLQVTDVHCLQELLELIQQHWIISHCLLVHCLLVPLCQGLTITVSAHRHLW